MKMKVVNLAAAEPVTEAVRDFLARGAERVEIVATTRGAVVSHCDISVQDEPMWQVRGEFSQDERVLAQPTPGLFDDE